MSGPIRHLSILQSPVFLINSRLDLFTAALMSPSGRPFSRSYRSILPSSLAMNLSSALEYSSQLPVSVYGTGRIPRFSWKSIQWIITAAVALVYYPALNRPFNVEFRLHAPSSPLRHFYRYAGSGILTACPSTTPLGFALGPD